MSNHTGSYLLNEVFSILIREKVFEPLGRETTQQIVLEIVNTARQKYDCNYGEILEDHAQTLGICLYCLKPADKLKHGLCRDCRIERVQYYRDELRKMRALRRR